MIAVDDRNHHPGVQPAQCQKSLEKLPFLHFTITDPDAWAAAKARMTPDPARVDWAHLERNYGRWRREGAWIRGHFWFGFDVTHSWMVGTERVLLALIERPE
ncbi:MAG TPA: hypothetical protein PLR50_08825, partial [Candidatus Rifleibacterium sp.]|nr:hypothetical protein [Candidatus Rifleibacterium sp.]